MVFGADSTAPRSAPSLHRSRLRTRTPPLPPPQIGSHLSGTRLVGFGYRML